MWFNINIDFTQIRKNSIEIWKKELDKFADKVLKWVKSRTPEREKVLLKAINKTEQIFTWTKILQQVKDTEELDYTAPVEYWVLWRIYNYHKPRWSVFWVWVWAAMFRRTYAEMKDKFNW
jgi:hypothetical protein